MRKTRRITDPTFDLLVYMARTGHHGKTIDHAVRGLNDRSRFAARTRAH